MGSGWLGLGIGAALLAALVGVPPAGAASDEEVDALKREMEELKQGQETILRQLEEIQGLLQRRGSTASFQPVEIPIAGAPVLGEVDAKVTLVEFSDYQCPFCARFSAHTLPNLVADYVASGKLRLIFLDFPIGGIHPAAVEAAIAARCAGAQGKYWEMHDRFFALQKSLAGRDWLGHAASLGLDGTAYEACLAEEDHKTAVRRDMAAGRRAGVRGTPTFFLGLTEAGKDTLTATKRITGARPYAQFKAAIEELLAGEAG